MCACLWHSDIIFNPHVSGFSLSDCMKCHVVKVMSPLFVDMSGDIFLYMRNYN